MPAASTDVGDHGGVFDYVDSRLTSQRAVGSTEALGSFTAGVALRAPLAHVPENTMKFAVGLMLTTFGIFWVTEGAGASWPGSDLALLVLLAFVSGISAAFVAILRRSIGSPNDAAGSV